MIRRLFRLFTRSLFLLPSPGDDVCPWCFAAMSAHTGGVECKDALQIESPTRLDVRQQTENGREMGERRTGKYPAIRKATGLDQATGPWDPNQRYSEES